MSRADGASSTTRVVGVDIGTSGVKASLITVREGVVTDLRSASVAYAGTGLCRDPEEWVRAAYQAVTEVRAADEVDALGFSGQMHALVGVDEAFRVLRPALLWLDYVGDGKLRRFVLDHPEFDFAGLTGNVPLPDFTLAKWLAAVDEDPVLAGRVAWLVGAKDYVRARMCGLEAMTDWNEAGGTQLFDPFSRSWSRELCDAAHVPARALPQVRDSTAIIGPAQDRSGSVLAARAVVGTGDQAAASRAVGATTGAVASLSLGTSGVVARSCEFVDVGARPDPSFHLFPLDPPGSFHVIGTVPSVGPTLRWLSDLLRIGVDALPAVARSANGRTDEVMFFPYLGGRGAPHADAMQGGAFTGLREGTTAAEIAQAVYNGVALEISSIVGEMRGCGGAVSALVCSGGAARDPQLVGTIAAAVHVPCLLSSTADCSSVGAALLAYDALAVGDFPCVRTTDVRPVELSLPVEAWLVGREGVLRRTESRNLG